jgi:fatty acid amide hydrolase
VIGYRPSPATDADPLDRASAGRVARAVSAGEVSPADVVRAAVGRADAAAGLNACAVPLHREALAEAEARGAARDERPLAGVPVSVKESLWVRGTASCAGIDRYAGRPIPRDGEVAEALRGAGAIVLGKGNVSQALWYAESENPVYGRTEHPSMPGRSPGGSSGGDAALVAAGVVPVAVGTDIGGSVRIPAAWCGVFGMVPTPGRVRTAGSRDTQLFAGQDLIANRPGVLARDVSDLRLVTAVLAVADPRRRAPASRRPLRVGVLLGNGVLDPAPAVRRAVLEAASALGRHGVALDEVELPDAPEALDLFDRVFSIDGGRRLRRMLAGSRVHPHVALALAAAEGRACTPEQTRALAERIAELRARFGAALARRRLDAVLGPVHAVAAVPHGSSQEVVRGQSYASVWSLFGMPAGVAPVTVVRPGEESDRTGAGAFDAAARRAEEGSAGLPIGVQVAARPGADEVVLTLLEGLSSHWN